MSKDLTSAAQTFAAYMQKNKNTTNASNTKLSTKSAAQIFKERQLAKEEEEKERERISLLNDMRMQNMERNLRNFDSAIDQAWSIFPEGAREEARFRDALNPNPIEIEPKNVSYEEAKRIFDEYDYYVENPITYREYQKLPIDQMRKLSPLVVGANSFADYIILRDPESLGYTRPRTEIESEGLSRRVYNQELTTALAEYNRRQSENIDLDKITNTAWDSYLQGLHGSTEVQFDKKKQRYIERDVNINSALDKFYDSHNSSTRAYDTFTKLEPIIHSSNVTNSIIDSFPKDNNGNIIINGEAFPEYFVYRQIFGITANKFGEHILKDAEESADGLGMVYLDDLYKKNYGMTYEDYMHDIYYNRVKEIRDRLEVLGKKMTESEKTENMSNSLQWGYNEMDVMLPRKWKESLADSLAEGYTTHPFENAIEELDATLSSIEGGKFSKGFISGFDWMNMASLGFSEVGGDFTKLQVLEKFNEGKSLTEDERYIYELVQLEEELKGLYDELNIKKPALADIGSGVGQFVADMPMFAAAMSATSGIGAGITYGTKFAFKKYLKQKTFRSAMNLAKRSAIDFSKMYAVNLTRGAAAAPFMSITYKSYANKALSQYSFDENGNLKYDPKNKWAMAVGAYLEGANEIASEYWGGAFDDAISLGSKAFGRATGISKWLNKSEVGTWMRRVSQAPISDATKKTLRNLGYTGILSEPLSEVWGDVMTNTELMFLDNTVNLINDGKNFEWKKDGRYFDTGYSFEEFSNPDYWITIMGVSTISGGAMTSVAAGRNILTQAKYAKQLVNNKNKALNEIKNEELKNTLRLLGDSENFVNAAIELANFDWEGKGISLADKTNAINYIRTSYALQTTMGDMESQRHMMSFEDTVNYYYNREFTSEGKHTGRMYTAFDAQGNTYNILNVEEKTEDGSIKSYRVIDDAGNISIKLDSELFGVQEELIDNIIAEEYSNTFSSEIESTRLNNVRQTFERISNPTETDIRRLTSEFGIRKPEIGKTVKLVDDTEAIIKEDLKNGNYIVERYNPETIETEDIEIPVHNILSNNPISAAAQKTMFEDAKVVQESGNSSIVPESHKSSEDKVNDVINADYDSKLFDERGAVKLNEDQVISTFSTEDPNILGDYIKKVGNRVSPQVKKALDNALELSKIHNEINPQLSHLVQTSKNRTDVAILSNVLEREVITSNPNITAEELLESIINNKNYNSKIIHDFKNILKALTNAKVQRRTTTKTDTSKTQKDVRGKRGRKTIESSLKRFRQAVKQDNIVKALYEISFIDETRRKTNDIIITDEELNELEEARKTFKERGYEIKSLRGTNYHEGQTDALVEEFIRDPNLPAGTAIVTEVITPAIYKDGQLYKPGKVKVAMGPEIEEETPDISQAVTKEMTEEEPMDFSEPTDNTVESKKEDSVTHDPIEPNPLIPELESAFKKVDTENMSETPSREEEVETLAEEQRREVTIQDSVNPNMREFKVDSVLPDDITADEVIPDKHEVQGNRIYRYDGKQLREDRKQVRRIPNRPNDEHGSFYKWLEDNNTDLQGIIDNELSDIAALNPDVKFMMLTEGTKSGYPAGSKILNVVFQVVEYTDAIKKIHKESRGGIITSEGTKYLVIGTTGFRPALEGVFNPELNHYSFLADIVLKAARNQYTSNTNEIEREAYYVHPSMSTKIKDIQAGWITTQTENDSSVQERPLIELFNEETRNPHGIKIGDSKWLIPTKNESKPITVRVNPNDVVHGLQIPTGLAGAVFLLVPAANGHYIPVSVKIGKTNELSEGKLKDAIWNTAQQLLSDDPDIRNYSIKELCKLLNLTKEGYNIIIDDKYIDFDSKVAKFKIQITSGGTTLRTIEVDPLNIFDANIALSDALFSKDDTKGIPFQLNIGLQTLTTSSELEMYMESGALKTEAAVLGTVNASYTVHSIDMNLKADPYTEQPTDSQEGSYNDSPLRRGQGNGVIYIGKNQYFRFAENSYMDIKEGEVVTDAVTLKKIEKHLWLEKHKPTPAKIEKGSGIKLYILSENEVMTVTKNGDISFITDKDRVDGIIKSIKEEADNKVRAVNAKEELSHVEEQQQAEQEIPRMLQEEQEADVPEVDFTEDFDSFKDTEVTPVEGSFEEVSFETREEYTPKEKISETFTEGVVENVGADQLLTAALLRDTKKQLIKEKIPKEKVSEIMDNIFNKLKEEGLESFYTSADESTIRSIIDIFTHCRNK